MTATNQIRFNELQSALETATQRKDEANEALDKAERQLTQAKAGTLATLMAQEAMLSRAAYLANECVCDLEDKLLRLMHSGSEIGELPPKELCF